MKGWVTVELQVDENLSLLSFRDKESQSNRQESLHSACLIHTVCVCVSSLSTCCHTLARGRPQALSVSRGQTVCPRDKTTRSLLTMLVWKSVKK